MSTRSSIWLGESEGKSVHIYWELADRDVELGRKIGKMVAPIYIAVDEGDSNKEVAVQLPKAIAEEMLKVLFPQYREQGHEVS
jgi:hypothetical protein